MAAAPSAPTSRSAWKRHVTLLFSDLSDSTKVTEQIPPEDCLDVLDHLRGCMDRVLAKHGGTLVNVLGDGFLAMFGFPEASEHDGRRATEAALELHEAIASGAADLPASVPRPLSMHSGIHAGRVLVITEAEPPRYSLVGDATNTVARMSDRAKANEILVSATTLGTERHFFELLDLGDLRLEGKRESIAAWQVLGRAPVATRFQARVQHGLTPFAGRVQETAALQRALETATAGHLQVMSIVGSPGIGKTRLAEEFLQRSATKQCAVHRAYCEEHSAEPLQPIRQMLRAASAPVAADNPDVVRTWFASIASARPVVIFIDDWQWADDATRRTLAAVRELQSSRILIVTTSRWSDANDPSTNTGTIVLSPLDDRATEQTIRTLRPDDPPGDLRELKELAGGNPLYIEELCLGVPKAIADWRKVDGGAWLNTLIESRLARLPSEQAELVKAAAMIGMEAPGWLLEQLTGYGEDHPVVRSAASSDLVFRDEADHTLRFKHGITREVIYESLDPKWRKRKHEEIAELLERHNEGSARREQFEALAYHYRAADRRDQAALYAGLAGDKALAAAALDRARTQYTFALNIVDPQTRDDYQRWIEIAQRFGLACVYDADPEHLALLQRAVDLAAARQDRVALARTQYWVGYVHYSLGQLGHAIAHLEEALRSCEHAAAAELRGHRLQVLATLGQAHAATGEYEAALGELEEVIQAKERDGRPPTVGSAYTRACYGAVLGDVGRFEEAHASFAKALEAVREGNHPVKGSVLALRGWVFTKQQRWADALACATEAQHIGERIESLYVLAISQTLRGYARWRLEGTPDAIEMMERAVSWLEARHKRLFISASYGWLAETMLETDRYKEARLYGERALGRANERDPFGEAAAYRVLAQLPAAYRDHSPEDYIERAFQSARRRCSPHEERLTRDVAASLHQ